MKMTRQLNISIFMDKFRRLNLVALTMLICPLLSWGSALSDPTRPPAIWLTVNGINLPSGNSGKNAPSGVQLIMIGPSKKFAIINGKIVRPGKPYNGSTVIDINSEGVITKNKSKSLKLLPRVRKSADSSSHSKRSSGKSIKKNQSATKIGENL